MTKTKEKKSEKAKRHLIKAALLSALAGSTFLLHRRYPTTFPSIYYMVTDPFVTTPTEQRIETKFGIDYEGDSNEERQKALEEILRQIYDSNPQLLTYCKKIVLHSEAVKNSRLIKPFLRYEGFADGETINIVEISLGNIVHEQAHIKHFYTPNEFDIQLAHILGDSYNLNLKKGDDVFWNDYSDEPRDGFVEPYGATNARENVATYVEQAYSPLFWENEPLQKSDKYLQTLTLLQKYDFITLKQFEEIKETLEDNNPEYISTSLSEAIAKVESPKPLREEGYGMDAETVLYENKNLKISYVGGRGERQSISLTVQVGKHQKKQKSFNFIKKKNGSLELYDQDKKEYVPDAVVLKLTELGYDKYLRP